MTTPGETWTATELDERSNNVCAAGGVFVALYRAGLEPEVVVDDGEATNAIIVKLSHMKSRYRLTVEPGPDDDNGVVS